MMGVSFVGMEEAGCGDGVMGVGLVSTAMAS